MVAAVAILPNHVPRNLLGAAASVGDADAQDVKRSVKH